VNIFGKKLYNENILAVCVQKDGVKVISHNRDATMDLDKVTRCVNWLSAWAKDFGDHLVSIEFEKVQLTLAQAIDNQNIIAWSLTKKIPVSEVRPILMELAAEVAVKVL
jgi:hypothetical protein